MVGSLHEVDVILGEGRNSLHGDNVKDADEEMAVELRDMPEDEEDEIPAESMGMITGEDTVGKRRESSNVERATMAGVCCTICFLLAMVSLGAATLGLVIQRFDRLEFLMLHPEPVRTVQEALGLPGYRKLSWNDITMASYGQSVAVYMYGPSAASFWVKNWLSRQVREEYAITLNVTEISTTVSAVNIVTSECDSDCQASEEGVSGGSVDMIWINGDNFYNMKSGGYLYGPWAQRVPSAANFDWTADDIAYDFGEPTQGYEMPFNKAQLVLVYNKTKIGSDSIPQSMPELVAALDGSNTSHPLYGKFSYPAPPDFTGAAFLRMFLYAFGGGVSTFDGEYNAGTYSSHASTVMAQLLAMEPGIYQTGGGPYYCSSLADCNTLFLNGQIAMTMSYNPGVAGANIAAGIWSGEHVDSYVPNSGSIANNNFWTIPKNANNKLPAIVVANYVASMGAQFNRRGNSNRWIQAYDPTCDAVTDELAGGWGSAFEYLEDNVFYNTTPSKTYLTAPYSLNEVSSQYKTALNADWTKCFVDRETGSPCSVG